MIVVKFRLVRTQPIEKIIFIFRHANKTSSLRKCSNLLLHFHSSVSFYILNREHRFVKLTYWRDVGAHVAHRPLGRDDAGQ